MLRKWCVFGVALGATLIVGLAVAQQSSVGGQSARARLTSLGVGQAAPAGTGNITATGTVTAANFVGNVGGIATSDLARLSQANEFTGGRVAVKNAANPHIEWWDTAQAADQKRWLMDTAANCLRRRVVTDVGGGSVTFETVCRTGTTIDSINLAATAVQVNGQSVRDGAILTSIPSSGVLSSGTYTPTLTNGTNVAASTSAQCNYLRVGNVVTVSGAIFVDPTAGSTGTIIDISLPIASALSVHSNLAGAGSSSSNGNPLNIQAQTVTDTARVLFLSDAGAGNVEMTFTFTYVVL